jgi:5-methylcytosine-specific restriction enzyme subunit McrC
MRGRCTLFNSLSLAPPFRRGLVLALVPEGQRKKVCKRNCKRLRVSETLSRGLLSRVQIACSTDDLSRDVLHNQIIKATLERLTKTAGVDAHLCDGIAAILSALSDIRSISLTARDFGRVQLHGNNAAYGFLLRVCALAFEALLPEPGTGHFRFRDVLADPQAMGFIFQDFVRNFFRLEQNQFSVKDDQVRWDVDMDVGFGHQLLPVMNTDTSLFDGNRTIIVECKWTPHTLRAGRGGKRTLNEEHPRQLHTYMAHHARTVSCSGVVEGLLLYPLADEPVAIELMVKGQRLQVRTIDLATGWPDIRAQMLSLLSDACRSYAVKIPNSLTAATDGQLDGARPCTAI